MSRTTSQTSDQEGDQEGDTLTLPQARDELALLQDASTPASGSKKPPRRRHYTSELCISFHRVICDEGHRVKTISSHQHQSVALLNRRSIWFLTATPMWNKPLDFCGYLSLLWTDNLVPTQADPTEDSTPPTLTDSPLAEYEEWSQRTALPTTNLPYPLRRDPPSSWIDCDM
ncbi:Helicase C-terminal [Penicillium solitum]|uniref:Helicase C-terminal n=1 Tax=Penicillium solitum TaxID=60172 RepID=UPI0032C43378|nr:Helicase C-terminal [Penicillium solitum]